MAQVWLHGEVGQIERTASIVAYTSDGKILRNTGDGFQEWKTLKEGRDPIAAYEQAVAREEAFLRARPCVVHYRRLLKEFAPELRHRVLVHTIVSIMPGDPDGVWSELCDSEFGKAFCEPDIEDVCRLCSAYEAVEAEANIAREDDG